MAAKNVAADSVTASPQPAALAAARLLQAGLRGCKLHSAAAPGCTACPRIMCAIEFLHQAGFWELLKPPPFYGSGWVISQDRKDRDA